MNEMMKMAAALGDLFMPRKCLVCGRTLGVEERYLCLSCAADLPLTHFWDRTHNPMADRLNACLQDREGMPYAYAAALFFYDEDVPYKMIPRTLKYEYGIREGRYFAAMLGRYLAASEAFADVDCVVPVPLHWLRRLKRGYNQAAVIARAVAKEMGVPCREDVLRRARRTATQTRLGGEDRARNVAGAFRVGRRFLDSALRAPLEMTNRFLRAPLEMTNRFLRSARNDKIGDAAYDTGVGNAGQNDKAAPSVISTKAAPSVISTKAGLSVISTKAGGRVEKSPAHILLGDDVFTTGSTTTECFRVLAEAFPDVRISVATLAFVE